MKAIKKRVDKAKIHSPDQLSLIIHELQHEVQMFVQRGEQLKEATVSMTTDIFLNRLIPVLLSLLMLDFLAVS